MYIYVSEIIGNQLNIGEAINGWENRYHGKEKDQQRFSFEIDIGYFPEHSHQDSIIHDLLTKIGGKSSKFLDGYSSEIFPINTFSNNMDQAKEIVKYIINAKFKENIPDNEIINNALKMKGGLLKLSFDKRPYQLQGIEKLLACNDDQVKGIFAWPRAGKSIMALSYLARRNKKKILVISGKPNEIHDAWIESSKKYLDFVNAELEVDIESTQKISIRSGYSELGAEFDENAESIISYLKEKAEFYDAIIVDEFHFASWHEKYTNAFSECGKEVLLITGTPYRPTNLFPQDDHIVIVNHKELIDAGICIPLNLYYIEYENLKLEKLYSDQMPEFFELLADDNIQSDFYKNLDHGMVVVNTITEAQEFERIMEKFRGIKVINLAGDIEEKCPNCSLEKYINQKIEEFNNKRTLFVTCGRALCGVSIPKINTILWMTEQDNMSRTKMEQGNARVTMALTNKETHVYFITPQLTLAASLEWDPKYGYTDDAFLEALVELEPRIKYGSEIRKLNRQGAAKKIDNVKDDFINKYFPELLGQLSTVRTQKIIYDKVHMNEMLLTRLNNLDLRMDMIKDINEKIIDTKTELIKDPKIRKRLDQVKKKNKELEKFFKNNTPTRKAIVLLSIIHWQNGNSDNMKWLLKRDVEFVDSLKMLYEEVKDDIKIREFFDDMTDVKYLKYIGSLLKERKYIVPEELFEEKFWPKIKDYETICTPNFYFAYYCKNKGKKVAMLDVGEMVGQSLWSLEELIFFKNQFNLDFILNNTIINKRYNNIMPRFDVIIANPPYNKGLHLKMLEKSLNMCPRCIFLQPNDWLVTPEHKKSKEIKQKIDKHIESMETIPQIEANEIFGITNNGNLGIVVYDLEKPGYKVNDFVCPLREKLKKLVEKELTIEWAQKNTIGKYGYDMCTIHGHQGKRDFYDIISPKTQMNIHDNYSDWSIDFNTSEEAKNFRDSLFTHFYKFLVSLNKKAIELKRNTMPFMNNYKEPWTNERFAKYFNINDQELKQIIEEMNFFYY